MSDTERAKTIYSNKDLRSFKCKILIGIIGLFQYDSFLAVVVFSPVYIYLYVIGVVSVHSLLYTSKNVSLQTYVKFIVKRQCFSDF